MTTHIVTWQPHTLTSTGGEEYALTSLMGTYLKSGSMCCLIRKRAPGSNPACLIRRMRTRHWDLPQTVFQVMKRCQKVTPKVKRMIVNGLAPVAMKSARTPQTRIPTRNLTSLISSVDRLWRLACCPMSLKVDYTKGMAWSPMLMRFIDILCALSSLSDFFYSAISRPDECRVL